MCSTVIVWGIAGDSKGFSTFQTHLRKKVSISKITFTASYSQGVKNLKKKRLKSLNNGIKGVVLHPQWRRRSYLFYWKADQN
jgi:hypothetical protein